MNSVLEFMKYAPEGPLRSSWRRVVNFPDLSKLKFRRQLGLAGLAPPEAAAGAEETEKPKRGAKSKRRESEESSEIEAGLH